MDIAGFISGPAEGRPVSSTRARCPTGKSKNPVQPFREKYSAFRFGRNRNRADSIPSHTRGVSRSSRTRDGTRWTRQRRARNGIAGRVYPVSDQPARGRTALQRLRQTSAGGTWPVEGLAKVAADGEVVWSWHPLLMSSWRRCVGPTGLRQAFNPLPTVTKRNSSPGRARRKPLKPLRGESRVISGVPVVTTVCLLHCTRAAGATGTRLSLRPLSFEGQCSCTASGALRRESMKPCLPGSHPSQKLRLPRSYVFPNPSGRRSRRGFSVSRTSRCLVMPSRQKLYRRV
jgi:hypothetical protein